MRYIVLAFLLTTTSAAAQLRPLVEPPASLDAARNEGVTVFLINEGMTDISAMGPAEIDTVAKDGTPIRLIAPSNRESVVAGNGFVKLQYVPAPIVAAVPVVAAALPEAVTVASRGESRGLLDHFAPHEPIYGAFGLQDAGGKLQLSFAFRLLGRADGPRLNFAYTQNMLWAIDRSSGPIGPTTYSPEVFVDLPLGEGLVGGAGYRHDSNGEGPARSIDVNRAFVRLTKSFDLGGEWRAELTPQAWFYIGDRGSAPDLNRYWGYTSLTASIGRQDGIKLSGMVRGNPGTGKGSGELFISYPLSAIGLNGVYLFGQGFTGYGEALSNFDRHDTHARLGIAFTR